MADDRKLPPDPENIGHRNSGEARMNTQAGADGGHLETLRGWILAVMVLGLVGTVIELILLSHFEQLVQIIPVALIASSVIALAWHVMSRDAMSLKVLMFIMALFIVAGFAGFVAHFHGSAEFALELDPDIGGWDLFLKVLHAKAPPLLAPGMMLQLGLLGFAYALSDQRYRARAARMLGFMALKGGN
jgi:hypothetical protein